MNVKSLLCGMSVLACLAGQPAYAQFANQPNQELPDAQLGNYSNDEYVPLASVPINAHEGWQGLADLLHKLEPSVDTSIPESRSEAAIRISGIINSGRYDQALAEIAKLQKQDAYLLEPSTDVQLLFLKARALAGKKDLAGAEKAYTDMTFKYPELAEPWNNLGVLQMQNGLVDKAYESLKMAVTIRPNYGTANKNLGLLHLVLAQQAFSQAQAAGINTEGQRKAINYILSGGK